MTTTYKTFEISSKFQGCRLAPWSDNSENSNDHVVTVKGTLVYDNGCENSNTITFDFWGSIANPKIKTEEELLNAFYCFVSDAVFGDMRFEDFCNELGYDAYSRRAKNIWNACQKARDDLYSIYRGDIYDLANELAEIAG